MMYFEDGLPMMAVSTKGRYSLRIVSFLGAQPGGFLASKAEIAEAEGIPPAYVQQLMMRLVIAGLVQAKRGRRGGFSLARAPEAITVAEVLKASEGEIELVPCRRPEACERAPDCPTRPLWMTATDLLEQLFQGTTIAQLTSGDGSGVTTPELRRHLDLPPGEVADCRPDGHGPG
jgi:Rrf2 family protein